MSVRAVHHLNCATMCPVAGRWFGGAPGSRGRMVAHCLLVETARDGLVLIDTGFGTRDCDGRTPMSRVFKAFAGPTLDLGETALAQVEALGYAARDLRHVVVTHLDVDHAGGISDFPDAKVHLHAREHAAAMARASLRERERYIPAHWAHGPSWELYEETGDTWRGLPAITRLRGLGADIGLVPMHGHTRGHSAVIAKHGDRWLVHGGDAYFSPRRRRRSRRRGAGGFSHVRAAGADRRARALGLGGGAAAAARELQGRRSVLRARSERAGGPAAARARDGVGLGVVSAVERQGASTST